MENRECVLRQKKGVLIGEGGGGTALLKKIIRNNRSLYPKKERRGGGRARPSIQKDNRASRKPMPGGGSKEGHGPIQKDNQN